MQLLGALIDTPGLVVSREELQRCLWPADTFVDFENGLNTATKRLRAALSDSADQPLYIETLARAGYRFIAPVEWEEPRAPQPVSQPPPALRRRWPVPAGVAAIACCVLGIWLFSGRQPVQPSFRQVTFRRGPVFGARFAPDGQSLVFAAHWGSEPRQVYLNNGLSPESRPLGLEGSLFSISSGGELALGSFSGTTPILGADLFRAPMNGGLPVLAERSVMSADWSHNGRSLAIVRAAGGRNVLEYPPGRVLYSSAGWLSHLRFSPAGDRLAFVDHPIRHDDGGRLMVTDLAGAKTDLTNRHWTALTGLAWHPTSGEVWFSGSPGSLWAVTSTGRLRPPGEFPGVVRLPDISPSGSVLLGRESRRLESIAGFTDHRRVSESKRRGDMMLVAHAAATFSRRRTPRRYDTSPDSGSGARRRRPAVG